MNEKLLHFLARYLNAAHLKSSTEFITLGLMKVNNFCVNHCRSQLNITDYTEKFQSYDYRTISGQFYRLNERYRTARSIMECIAIHNNHTDVQKSTPCLGEKGENVTKRSLERYAM